MKYLVSFDICDNKRRRRVVKIILSYMARVQKSVFEGFLSHQQLSVFQGKILKEIDLECDSVRYYPLYQEAEKKIVVQGVGEAVVYQEVIII